MTAVDDPGVRLRTRALREAAPRLAAAVAARAGDAADPERTRHDTLMVLFGLLFTSFAEGRGLVGPDAAPTGAGAGAARSTRLWRHALGTWQALNPGDGTLPDLAPSDAELGPVLSALTTDTDARGRRRSVDFHALSVREFGAIYEALLAAPGQRKATGSYFTNEFAVEHLLRTALDPTLDEHLERVAALLRAGDGPAAARAFYDFRVADLSMGPGHFLVAAADHMAERMSRFLDRHLLPQVTGPLLRPGPAGPGHPAGLAGMLRREVAARCLFGVDLDGIAVTLARMGLGLHTAVPGLPVPDLSAHLVRGNALADRLPIRAPARPGAPGFDVVVGNPPWEEATLEENKFWSLYEPGLLARDSAGQHARIRALTAGRPVLAARFRALKQARSELRSALLSGSFPGMGTGDPDLYKAFAWQFLRHTRAGGRLGVVLPRSIFSTKGSAAWRQALFDRSDCLVVFAVNDRRWLFAGVNPGWSVALVTARPGAGPRLRVAGPAHDERAFRAALATPPPELSVDALRAHDPLLCLPPLRGEREARMFATMAAHPALGADRPDLRVRVATELHATNDGRKLLFRDDGTGHPVFNHVNVGHFAFDPTAGAFNHVDLDTALDFLQRRRLGTFRRRNSPFFGRDRAWAEDPRTLPARHPRVVLREVVHATNRRKVWAALAPAGTVLTNKAPYLVFGPGGADDVLAQAYVLGVLGSSACNWFGTLRVVLTLNVFILCGIPVPRYDPRSPACRRLARLAAGLGLGGRAGDYGAWAEIGTPLTGGARFEAEAEADALAVLLYGLCREDVGHLLAVLHDGDELDRRERAVTRHFDRWAALTATPAT